MGDMGGMGCGKGGSKDGGKGCGKGGGKGGKGGGMGYGHIGKCGGDEIRPRPTSRHHPRHDPRRRNHAAI
jgi:hypothetical protein